MGDSELAKRPEPEREATETSALADQVLDMRLEQQSAAGREKMEMPGKLGLPELEIETKVSGEGRYLSPGDWLKGRAEPYERPQSPEEQKMLEDALAAVKRRHAALAEAVRR